MVSIDCHSILFPPIDCLVTIFWNITFWHLLYISCSTEERNSYNLIAYLFSSYIKPALKNHSTHSKDFFWLSFGSPVGIMNLFEDHPGFIMFSILEEKNIACFVYITNYIFTHNLILVFRKNELSWSKVTVNTFVTWQKSSIWNNCFSF